MRDRRTLKHSGFRHLLASTRYSIAGARRLFCETAFRHELLGYGIVTLVFAVVGTSLQNHLIVTIMTAVLIGVEALNTAIEEIMDFISADYSMAAKHAKDLGSFAVLCLIGANALFVAYVLFG